MPRAAVKREQIYWYYVAHIKARGYAPTLKEAAAATDSSYRYVSRCIGILVDEGRLALHPRRYVRGVVLPDSDERSAA